MSIEQELKQYALERTEVDLIGIASIDRFEHSLPGRHPLDILPGAKSVIVIGVGLLNGACQAAFRFFEEGKRNVHGIYGTYGYTIAPNYHLMWASYYLSRYIERHLGAVATPVPAGPQQNGAPLSLRHAAVAAGLGEFGWQGDVLSPQFGPRNRFGAILTQAELIPDPMYSGPKLCDPSQCQICVQKCTMGAISPYEGPQSGRFAKVGSKTEQYGFLNWNRCRVACMALSKRTGGLEDLVCSEDPTAQEIEEAEKKIVVTDGGLQHIPTWKCGICINYCPVGNWKQKFGDTGLSCARHLFEQNQVSHLNDRDGQYNVMANSKVSREHGDYHPDGPSLD